MPFTFNTRTAPATRRDSLATVLSDTTLVESDKLLATIVKHAEVASKWILFPALLLSVDIILMLVMISTPIIRSINFVRVDVRMGKDNGQITFGTLGYCVGVSRWSSNLKNTVTVTTCSSPTLLYVFDNPKLLDNNYQPNGITKVISISIVLAFICIKAPTV